MKPPHLITFASIQSHTNHLPDIFHYTVANRLKWYFDYHVYTYASLLHILTYQFFKPYWKSPFNVAKATVGKSDAQNNKHVSGEAAGSKYPTSHAELGLEIEIIPDMSGAKIVVERKGVSVRISGTKLDLFLDQLCVDVTGTIIVMIGRVWDASGVSDRYLSTDFVMCDAKGQMIHCFARASVAHNILQLKEGGIYSVTNFMVKPNKEEYRVIKDDSFMLEFDGSTTFKRVSVKEDGFLRYILNLVDFDAIELADNKCYWICFLHW
ncbi:reverse transcriptase domain-containing protein [Tanacetum coccineum]|uniref:Reverse transcriptase domain-containing protein n=1 Tax=Tanacetum coccineum TaxID=301880 RepID=A0ABQ4ZS76_9ASTR